MNKERVHSHFISVKTRENTVVHLRPELIVGIEEIPATLRAPGHLKVYAGGYHFILDISLEEFRARLDKPSAGS